MIDQMKQPGQTLRPLALVGAIAIAGFVPLP